MSKGRRNVGDDLADKMEAYFGLPQGSMDQAAPGESARATEAASPTIPTLAQALEVVASSLNQLPDERRELAAQRLQTLARAPDSARAMESLLAAMRPAPSPPPPESRDFHPPVPSGLFVKHKQPS